MEFHRRESKLKSRVSNNKHCELYPGNAFKIIKFY